jgi:hypothetical protein
MSTITCRCMFEHSVRQRCPWITDFLFQEAEDPQPCASPSTFAREIKFIGTPAGFQRIKLDPLPWQR